MSAAHRTPGPLSPMSALCDGLDAADLDFVHRCEVFARDVVAPCVRDVDTANVFPAGIHRAAHDAGLMNAGFERSLGGQGLSQRTCAAAGVALARVDAPVAFSLAFNHGTLRPIVTHGTPEQRRRLVGPLLAARGSASWCMTEPDASGSDLIATKTRADRRAGGFVITGGKVMTGNGTESSLFLVLADAYDGGERLGPTIFCVPRSPGVSVSENTPKIGFRCVTTPDVNFDDVFVDDNNVIGQVGGGVPVLRDSLDYMRVGGGVVCLGLCVGAFDDVLPWLEGREIHGGRRLIDESHVQVTLGRLLAEVIALEHLLAVATSALDRGATPGRELAALKLLGSDLAQRVTAAVVQFAGWRGINGRFFAEKRFRDARPTTIYEGTNEVLAMGLFRDLLREDRARRPLLDEGAL